MKTHSLIGNEIQDFYSRISDEDRFTKGLGPLEFERNKELISALLKNPRSTIVDVTGVYSEWLSQLGHHVHLVDPVEKHIKKARIRAGRLKNKFYCYQGNSLELGFDDAVADLVILHGPLYHLQDKKRPHK
jgi:ubiquinone/menaquinone biosynthesis C-methylase UbiE